ncbi:AAA family ATPase [Aquincola sp. S2]|uniref:AAA family ATPase n=1 Tax=Pseudaquabacterium terrae TaxID=2732868 RepID=A0ABX2EP23_9BURK|nr:BTAD domain-containing putative transcriptional regulator [Aquabacterium terrae]NRF70312.1 AAA family ATPase [Aquabacterium terrae]
MLALELLGPMALRRDGRPLPLTVKKTQALLVLLARGGVQPRLRIAALLWPELDESTGRRNLRRELARLRDAGAADAVAADGDMLAPADELVIDSRVFEHGLADGRPDDALALWRGPLADGLVLDDAAPFDEWLAQQRESLQRLRQRALEASAQAHEARGNAVAALQRIETLLAEDPLQEQRHRDAMRLLAACGQREAALAQYTRCRSLLQQELGLQPMAETEALLAALRGGAAMPQQLPPQTRPLPPAVAGPAALLPEILPFVGREAELAWLEGAWRTGNAVLVEGEGGLGKTRLVLDFVAAQGPYAVCRCRPGDSEVPYAAFTRALRALAGPAPVLDGVPRWVADELARLLPELGVPPPAIRSGDEHNRFFEACAQGWQLLAGENFDAVVLDDWHHADTASHSLLAFVAQRRREFGCRGARECVVLRPELAPEAMGRLTDGLQALTLRLPPLDEAAVFDLVRLLSGASGPHRFAARLRQATAGNPFFIAETLRHLAEQQWLAADAGGVWYTPFDDAMQDYHELPVPASVREAVLGRVQRLGAASVRVLEAAALAGEPFAPLLLAPACALSELAVVLAIEAAVAAQLLREHESGGFAFAHDQVRQALEASLTPERRRLVHRRLALAAVATDADPAQTAVHFESGGEPARAVALRLAAGDAARRLFANPQAHEHWQAALADGPTPRQALQLQLRCAQVQADLGDGPGALERISAFDGLSVSAGLASEESGPMLLAVAELEADLQRAAAALLRIDALLAGPCDAALRAKALRVRGHALVKLGRIDDAQQALQAALDLAASGPLEQFALLDTLAMIEYQRGNPLRALALVRQATALSKAHGDRRGSVIGHHHTGVLLMILGEVDAAWAELERARVMAAEMHLIEQERDVILNLIKIHADRGEVGRVLALADEAWRLSPAFARPRTRQSLLQARFHGHSVLGQLGPALAIAEQVLADAEREPEPHAFQYAVLAVLDLLVFLGDFDRGRALLQRLAGRGTDQMAYLGVKVAFNQAFLETRAGNPVLSRHLLAEVRLRATLEEPQDRATLALREAELQLAEGDARAALASLEPWRDAVPNVELLALIWAVRLAAQQRLGEVAQADWQQARAALEAGRMPALEALELQRALLASAALPHDAQALAASVQQTTARLADSLADWPDHRARFLARLAG